MYQTPRHLSHLESQAASGTIVFLAATSPEAGPWQYRLYYIDVDSLDADPDEAGPFLLVRVGENGSVHEVASPRMLAHQSWAEDAFDALWEAQERGELPAEGGEPSPETAAAEQDIVARITSRPALLPARSAAGRAPSGTTSAAEVSVPVLDRPQRREDLNDGDLVWHLGDRPQYGPDPEELIEAVVMMVPGSANAEILVQDLDADDEPYTITFDMVVERQIPHLPPPVEAVRYRPHEANLPPSGPLGRIRANIAAIRTLHVLREEQRPATADEQAVLARWSSWGAVPRIFDPRKRELASLRAELRSLLTETEWYAAEATTRNAHFTDPGLVQPIWQAIQDLGFTDGRVLEPGSGSGNFLAFAPEAAQMTGVEIDPVTAEVSAALYPDATIRAESFVATRLPEGYFDGAVGNVPFDEIAMTDPVHNPLRLATHNHFIVKSLELVRPGGLVAVLTSRYTLDAMGKTARLEIADRADLVGAVRLPAGAHRRVAGTDAVTDLLILRRRDGAMPATPPEWVGLSPVQISPDTSVLVNSYFAEHPEMILGSLDITSSQFTDQVITVRPRPGTDLTAELSDALTTITRQAREAGLTMSASPDAVQRAAVDQRAERMRQAQELYGDDLQRYEGTILDQHDGTFLQVVGSELAERPVYRNATQELSSLLRLRDTYIDLLSAESTGDMDQATALRQQLNQFYSAHTGQYGFLNARDSRRDRRSAHGAFRSDPFAAGVYALEIYDADTQTARRSVIFTRPVTPPQTAQTTADTPQDALAISLNTYGEVRLSEIARLLDFDSLDEARDALGDMVFNQPGSQRLIPAAEYLSGNVRAKIEAAEKILAFASPESRETHPFQANIEALRGALPPDKQPGDIDVIQIGVTWVAPKYYEQFLQQLLQSRHVTVTRTSGADWEVDAPAVVRKGRAATKVYGTVKRNAIDLAERLLRRSSLVVHPPKQDEDASQQDIQDAKRWAADQTERTVAKADELNRLFADWLWQDPDRTTAVLHDYNRLFNSFVPYQGDGAHLTFPGLSDAITPRPHQRAGVARVLTEPHGSFLDYEVGFGKTLTIAMSLMEMKRLGMVRKPCIVVKNPTVNDFRNDFLKAYPGARVLAIDSSEFTKETAASYIAQIANGDWDAIILPQSLFKRIPMSGRGQQQFVADQTAEYRARIHKALTGSDDALSAAMNPGGDPLIADALEAAAAVGTTSAGSGSGADRDTVKKLQGDLKRHTQRAEKNLVKQTMSGISWEQTGIDFIAVDEVQDFANGEVGANNSELALPVSAQSKDLKIKLSTMAKAFGPKVGLGSTGTPFPNAMPQAYVMLNYFRPDLLAAGEISAFSSFQAQYLTEVVAPEISPEGVPRIKERIGAFRNSLQFSQTWRTMADVKTRHDINMPIPKSIGETVVVPATDEDRAFMEEVAWRADLVRGGRVDASEDNLLKISNDGRMAAMDLRMIEREPDGPGKLDAAADKIAAIYHEFKDRAYTDRDGNPTDLLGALQLVFADRGTPSDNNRKLGKFVAYEYLRDELFLRGVPVDQIRFSQDAKTAEEKAALFSDARLGKVAVLIGSTETMGVGVNVQDRAIALHHIDCPWRPSDVTQREGRIVRQYNQHYDLDIPVQIYRWVKAGSFDSFMWQTVERKARFIDQVRTGRELDEQDAALDGDLGKDYLEFGEIKAIATGNPLLLKKLAADEQVRTLEAAYTNWRRTEDHLQHVVATADETLSAAQRQADMVGRALRASTETKGEAFRLELPDGTVMTKRQDAAVALRTKLALIHRQMGPRDGVSGWEEVGTLGGQPFQVRVNTVHDFLHFSITGLKDISQAGFTIDDVEALVNGDKAPLGLVTRLENQVERLDGLSGLLLGTVDQLAQEIERARGLVGSPFGKMDKLTRARAEAMQLDAEISGQAGARHTEEPAAEPSSETREMSAADMAMHDAQVMAAEFGGTAVVIQDGQWYGTATGVPPTGNSEDGAAAAPRPGQRPLKMLPDEELPDFDTIPGKVVADPQAMVEKSQAAQTAFRVWTQTETAQAFLDEMEDEDLEPDEDLQPNGPATNEVIELHDAYLHALGYRGEDPVEWTRRYGNVIAQSRNLADAFDTENLPENEQLDIVALRQVGDRIQDLVASTLASWAAHQAAAATTEPQTTAEVAARPEEAAPRAAANPGAGAEPFEDRAEYWTSESVALAAYDLFASGAGARLADGIDQEQALVHAAEAMIAESQQARQSRLLGLDHVVPWELGDTLARRARVVAEQWDREQRGPRQVSEAMAMSAAVRDHAARYRATVEDPATEAFQQWLRSDEPIDLLDEEAEEFIAGLSMTTSYTVTGPAGVRSVPRSGIDLAAGIAQLIADGTVIEETDPGWTLSTPEGNRFDIAPAPPASAVDGSVTPPGRESTPETAAGTKTAPVEETPQAGSANPRARNLAIFLGGYSAPGDLVVARQFIADSVAQVKAAAEARAGTQGSPVDNLVDEVVQAGAAATGAQQVQPADAFGQYDRLADAATRLADGSTGKLAQQAVLLAQRTERHLGRMHGAGRDLFDLLLDAAALDPDSFEVIRRNDPLKERPTPYESSAQLSFARSIVNRTYDQWPALYSSEGAEASDKLRAAMWQIREAPDADSGTALTDWLNIAAYALGASEEAEQGVSSSVLRDVAQRAYQHYQGLAAYRLAAANTPPYGPDRSATEGAARLADAWKDWLETGTARDLVERANRPSTDTSLPTERAAQEEIRQAHYAAEWSSLADGTLDDAARRTSKLAHTTYALVLNMREGGYQQTDDERVLTRLVKLAHEHAAGVRAAAAEPDTASVVHGELAARQEQLRSQAPSEGGAPAVAPTGAETPSGTLEIEHHYRGSVVRGVGAGPENRAVRTALERAGFKESKQKDFWYLPRRMVKANRDTHVRNLVEELQQLGRRYEMLDDPAPAADAAADDVVIPAGTAYTSLAEAEADVSVMYGAYFESRETPAGKRMTGRGVGARPDGEAVHLALEDLRQGPIGSSLSPFDHPAEDVVQRSATLARALIVLSRHLEEERFRAPVALRHLRTLTQYATLLASRTAATDQAGTWDVLAAPGADPAPAPAAPQQAATTDTLATDTRAEPATAEPPTIQGADALVAGPYTGPQMLEAFERLDELRRQVIDVLPPGPQPDGIPGPASAGPEEWFRGPARVDVPDGFVPSVNDPADLKPGDVVRIGFKRWLESKRLSYRTLMITGPRDWGDGHYPAAPNTRMHPRDIVAVPPDSRLLTGATEDRYTLRYNFTGRWEDAVQAGRAAANGEQPLTAALDLYRQAFIASVALGRNAQSTAPPEATRVLVARLLAETEHHLVRLSLTERIAAETEAAESQRREADREARQEGSQARDEETARPAGPEAKRAEIEEMIEESLAETHEAARRRAVQAASADDIIQAGFRDKQPAEFRSLMSEWLRVTNVPAADGTTSTFRDWFLGSAPGAEEAVAARVIDEVYAALAARAGQEQETPTAAPGIVEPEPVVEDAASLDESEPPANAAAIATIAESNGWKVTSEWSRLSDYSTPYYTVVVEANTARGWRKFHLTWEMSRGHYTYNAQRSAAGHLSGKSAKDGYRPRLSDVQQAVRAAAVPAPTGEDARVPAPAELASEPGERDTLFDDLVAVDSSESPGGPTATPANAAPNAERSQSDSEAAPLTEEHLRLLPRYENPSYETDALIVVVATLPLRDGPVRDVLLLLQSVEHDAGFGEDTVRGVQIVPSGSRLSTSLDGRWDPQQLLALADTRVLPLREPIPWTRIEELAALPAAAALLALSVEEEQSPPRPENGRRFSGTGQLRTHFKAAPMPHLPPNERLDLANLAAHPQFELAPNGQFAIAPDPYDESTWALLAAGSGIELGRVDDYAYLLGSGIETALSVMGGLPSREAAVAFSERLAAIRDHDGDPIPWDAPHLPVARAVYRHELDRLVLDVRAAFDRAAGHDRNTSQAIVVWELIAARDDRGTAPDGEVFADELEMGTRIWFDADDEYRIREVTGITENPSGLMTVALAALLVTEEAALEQEQAYEWEIPRNMLVRTASPEEIQSEIDVVLGLSPATEVTALQAEPTAPGPPEAEALPADMVTTVAFAEELGLLPGEVLRGDTGRTNPNYDAVSVPGGAAYLIRTFDPGHTRFGIRIADKDGQPADAVGQTDDADDIMPMIRQHARAVAETAAYEEAQARATRAADAERQAPPPAPAVQPQAQEETVAVPDPQAAAGPWSSRIQILTEDGGTFVSGTGGAHWQEEAELRELLKKNRAFAFRDNRWRYQGRGADRPRVIEEIRAYLRTKDAEEARAAAAAPSAVEYPPTPQQQAIIDAVLAGQDVAVQALAGTGKTSTMLMVARRLPEKRIAYIAFNRSIADEAQRKFPRNVTADTSHAFARRVMVNTPLRTKIGKAGRNGGAWHRPQDLAQALGLTAPLRYRGGGIEPEVVARIVKEAIVRFRESADPELAPHHLGEKWAKTPAATKLLDVVRRAWADIADPDSNKVLFSHDDYVKLWALTNPRLDYGLIIFDEAQDINPVLKKLIQDQDVQTVVVGDSHQAIYEFRGAIDALKDWPADIVLPLTQSWRFGPDVAALGNAYLELLGSDLVLEGNPALATSVGTVEIPDAVLSRTNVGAIGAVFTEFEAGRRVALVGGGRDIEDVAKAAQELQRGRRTKHPELSAFATWSEVRDHAMEEDDKSLQMFVRLVDRYSPEGLLSMIRDLVPEDAKSEETRPEVVVSTAHKAKGREWDNVRIAADFPPPKENAETGLVELPDPGELRLAYVTVTRAKGRLELGSLSWIQTLTGNEPASTPALPTVAVPDQAPAAAQQPETPATAPVAEATAQPFPTTAAEPSEDAGTPYATLTVSAGEQNQLIVAIALESGANRARPVAGQRAADLGSLVLPVTLTLPPRTPSDTTESAIVSDNEVSAWLREHLAGGPLEPAWEIEAVRAVMIGAARDTIRDSEAPSVEAVAAWLVQTAERHERLLTIAQANDQANFAAVFGEIADDLIVDSGSENLAWGYFTNVRRQLVLEAATPLAYRALRQIPPPANLTPAAAESTGQPATESAQESTPDTAAAPDTAPVIRESTGTAALPEPAPEEVLAPLPWNDEKIAKRAQAGLRRGQSASIPQLARSVGDAVGMTLARVVWEQDHPFAQFKANLYYTLDSFDPNDRHTRALVAEVATDLEGRITQLAEQTAAHYNELIEPARNDPSRLAAVEEQLTEANRHPEFSNTPVREAMILVMRTIDNAERTARQRGLKPVAVRNALDQVVGLAGSDARDGSLVPLMHDVLVPISVQADVARETMAKAGLLTTVLEEYTRLRSLIAQHEQRQTLNPAAESTVQDQPETAVEPVSPLTDQDIAAAFGHVSDHAFGALIFDMDSERPRRPEVVGGTFRLPAGTAGDSARETGILHSGASGMTIAVSADGTQVREGKLTWAKAIAWLRPALTSVRQDLVETAWRTGNALRRSDKGFTAIGEQAEYEVARAEVDALAHAVKEQIIGDALRAHEGGHAAALAARNTAAAQGDGADALISLDDLVDPGGAAERDSTETALERVRQLSAALPDRGTGIRDLMEVQPGDVFQAVSPRRLLFIARSRPSVDGGRVTIDGDLIDPGRASSPYAWSESWWKADERIQLQPLMLPQSLAGLVTLPGQQQLRKAAAESAGAGIAAVPGSIEQKSPPAGAEPTADSLMTPPVEEPPSVPVQEPVTEPQEAVASTEEPEGDATTGSRVQAAPYEHLEDLLRDLTETEQLHSLWADSPTGRALLSEARELQEETGFADVTEAGRVDTAMAGLLLSVDSVRARSHLLLGAYRNLLTTVARSGKSLADRQAFVSDSDRALLLSVYSTALAQMGRLQVTDDLQSLLDSDNSGVRLMTRYRQPQPPDQTAGPVAQTPVTATESAAMPQLGEDASPEAHYGPSEPVQLTSGAAIEDPTDTGSEPLAPTVSAADPEGVFDDFDFWQDVIGDDLVVGGVVYSSDVYEHDGEGGVRFRGEEYDEPGLSRTPEDLDAQYEALIEEADMAASTADTSETDDDLDRAFEDVMSVFTQPPAPVDTEEPASPAGMDAVREQQLRQQFGAIRQSLSEILTRLDAEPVLPVAADAAVESGDAADLDAAMDNARAEASYYWGTPEWSAIRTISQAAREFRGAVREAAFDYAQTTLSEVRAHGLDRTIQARTARAVSHTALFLAQRLERSGQRDSRGWRAAWGLHRAAATRADRLVGNLPPSQRIDLAEQLRRAWQWLTQRVSGQDLQGPSTAEPGRVATTLTNTMAALSRIYGATAERIGNLAQHPAWRRVVAVWDAGRAFIDRAYLGAGRMMADRQSLGTMRMLWVRTLEVISHAARALITRLDASGGRDGLRWNLLRTLHHAAEDGIAHVHGHLDADINSPLGTYEHSRPEPGPETAQAPATGTPTEADPASAAPRSPDAARFHEVALEVAANAFTVELDLVYNHGVPFADAVTMLDRMEQAGIVSAPLEHGIRDVLVGPERARELLDSLPVDEPPAQLRAAQKAPDRAPAATAQPSRTPAADAPATAPKGSELPQRRRATAPGEPSKIAEAGAARSRPAPARQSSARTTSSQLAGQARRLRERAQFAQATASTPAEERAAENLNRIADRSQEAADELAMSPRVGGAPGSDRAVLTATAYIAALRVHAQARGEQIPAGLLEGAMTMALDTSRQTPKRAPAAAAPAPARGRRPQQTEEQQRPGQSSAPSGVHRK